MLLKVEVKFKPDANPYLGADPLIESARILRYVATQVENYETEGVCRDFLGNVVGKWELRDD